MQDTWGVMEGWKDGTWLNRDGFVRVELLNGGLLDISRRLRTND